MKVTGPQTAKFLPQLPQKRQKPAWTSTAPSFVLSGKPPVDLLGRRGFAYVSLSLSITDNGPVVRIALAFGVSCLNSLKAGQTGRSSIDTCHCRAMFCKKILAHAK